MSMGSMSRWVVSIIACIIVLTLLVATFERAPGHQRPDSPQMTITVQPKSVVPADRAIGHEEVIRRLHRRVDNVELQQKQIIQTLKDMK